MIQPLIVSFCLTILFLLITMQRLAGYSKTLGETTWITGVHLLVVYRQSWPFWCTTNSFRALLYNRQ